MRRSSMLLAPMALLFALLLAACGNKGPLVYAPAPDDEDVEAVEDVVEPEVSDDAGPVQDDDPVETPPPGDDNG